jgi:hypothetical protein
MHAKMTEEPLMRDVDRANTRAVIHFEAITFILQGCRNASINSQTPD